MTLNVENINSLIEAQLAVWKEALDNFRLLSLAERKPIHTGALYGGAQHNPARIRSTGAAVDKKSIESRPCFLCSSNRPAEQFSGEWIEGWELLVNPYPILPVHFTIVSKEHRPQDAPPFEMAEMAEKAPALTFFFNGARAGASAPDHLHCQAVLKSEIPLIRLCEELHPSERHGFMSSEESGPDVPFHFVSTVISPDPEGMRNLILIHKAFGIDKKGEKDPGLINVFFWMGNEGLLRAVVIPRRAHRPSFYSVNPGEGMTVSPGAIDMGGLLILPRLEDFRNIDESVARSIYAETAFADSLPAPVKSHFNL